MNDLSPDDLDHAPALDGPDEALDVMCEAWVIWCRLNRLYPPQRPENARSRLNAATRPLRALSAEQMPAGGALAAFHIAYTCQPAALDKRVFEVYYVERIKPIKAAAAALDIGRAHFYRVLVAFRRRVAEAAIAFERGASASPQASAARYSVKPIRPTFVNSESVSESGDNAAP